MRIITSRLAARTGLLLCLAGVFVPTASGQPPVPADPVPVGAAEPGPGIPPPIQTPLPPPSAAAPATPAARPRLLARLAERRRRPRGPLREKIRSLFQRGK